MPDDELVDGNEDVQQTPEEGGAAEQAPAEEAPPAELESEEPVYVEPEWLDALYEDDSPPPQRREEPPRRESEYVPRNQSAQEQDPALARLETWLESKMAERFGPIAQGLDALYARAEWEHRQRVGEELGRTEAAIRAHYKEVFSRDPAIANQRIKETLDRELQAYARDAKRDAARGRFEKIRNLQSPLFAKTLLTIVKESAGFDNSQPAKAVGMAQPKARQVQESPVDFESKLGAETVENLKRAYGGGWRKKAERYIELREKHYGGSEG